MPTIIISSSPTILLIFVTGKFTSRLSNKPDWYWFGDRVPDGRSVSLQLHPEAVQNTVPQFIWAQEGKEQFFLSVWLHPLSAVAVVSCMVPDLGGNPHACTILSTDWFPLLSYFTTVRCRQSNFLKSLIRKQDIGLGCSAALMRPGHKADSSGFVQMLHLKDSESFGSIP